MAEKFRLVTRSDFDGLVCAVLFDQMDMLGAVKFVHPKDMQDGTVEITAADITTNLPYVEGVHLAFDHHLSETRRLDTLPKNYVINPTAPSAARVVYDHFGGADRFPGLPDELLAAVDKADSAQFTRAEILDPQGWVMLNFLMDPRTGLGRFHHFRISNYQLMMDMIPALQESPTPEHLLGMPDVQERVKLYLENHDKAVDQIERCAAVHDNLVVLDMRDEDDIWPTNRFTVYALFPDQNISMHVMWGRQQQNTVFAIGKSILKRTSRTNVGDLCLEYGGGGHVAAGTCQIENHRAELVRDELIERITADG